MHALEEFNHMGIIFTETPATVKLIRSMASDDMVVQAAQVSGKGENNPKTVPPRLIQALLNGRHGSPFEHTSFTFFIEAPLFVFREWQRHRISSFNEMSGRYTELKPKFYITPRSRKMRNVGSKMRPQMETVSDDVYSRHVMRKKNTAEVAWLGYQADLEDGIANESARIDLPLNIMSQMYWTTNARSLMNFVSLRTTSDDATVKSYPQWEIEFAANLVEQEFAKLMPHTHFAFVKNGRVAP